MSADALPEKKSCKLEFKDLQKQDMVDVSLLRWSLVPADKRCSPSVCKQRSSSRSDLSASSLRTGERNSLEPLSEVEESRLHDRGHQLAQQVDIVKSIERLRELKRKNDFWQGPRTRAPHHKNNCLLVPWGEQGQDPS